jgi:hypothetical protein
VARAASSVDRPAVGASTPAQALAPLPSPRLSMRGAQAPTSQGGPPPVAFFLLFLPRRRVLRGHRGESTCCSRSRNSSSLCTRRSRRRIIRSFLRAARSCFYRCAAGAHARARGMGGSDRAAFTATFY